MLDVYFAAGGWWVFRGTPLDFPVAGPYGSESEAELARDLIADNPLRLAEILSILGAA